MWKPFGHSCGRGENAVATLFGRRWSRSELERRCGDILQVAGIRRVRLCGGKEEGVECALVRTGSGLEFQVTLDRGMDISLAGFKGVPLAWRSPAGDVHPSFCSSTGEEWRASFAGGLMTGCGMSNVGAPCMDEGESLGLHGKLSHLPASDIRTVTEWEGDECRFVVSGSVLEQPGPGVALRLNRRITAALGGSTLEVEDRVVNEGTGRTPCMLLYHVNAGWPLLDERARLLLRARETSPRDADAAAGLNESVRFSPPIRAFREQVFYHDLTPDAAGTVTVLLANIPLGIGLLLRYRKADLPEFVEWKMMSEGMYALGLEPANCRVEGRARERAEGRLRYLEAGEERTIRLDLEVIEGAERISTLAAENGLPV